MTEDIRSALAQAAADAPHPGPRMSRWLANSSEFIAPRPAVPAPVKASMAAVAACLVIATGMLASQQGPLVHPSRQARSAAIPAAAVPPVAQSALPACSEEQQTYSSALSGFGLCYPGGWVLTDLSSPNLPAGAGTMLALGLPGGPVLDRIKPMIVINSTYESLASVEQEFTSFKTSHGAFYGTFENASQNQPRLQPRQLVVAGLPAEEILLRDADTGARSRVVLVDRGDRVVRIEQVSAGVTEEEFAVVLDSFNLTGGYTPRPQFKVERELTDPQMRNRA